MFPKITLIQNLERKWNFLGHLVLKTISLKYLNILFCLVEHLF